MTPQTKKGVALLWVTILSGILLIISGTMVSYIVKESQFSVRTDQSAQAYAYAKSGVDWATKYADDAKPISTVEKSFDFGDSNTEIDVIVIITPKGTNCSASYCIQSTGMVGPVTRTLEYEINPVNLSRIIPPSPLTGTITPSNRESFNFQFDFWLNSNYDDKYNNTVFGLSSSSGYIALQISGIDGNLQLLTSSGTVSTAINLRSEGPIIKTPFTYRAKIKYFKDTAATLTIFRRNPDGSYTCVGSALKDLRGLDLGNLNTLKINSTGTYITSGTTVGDGEYLQVTSPLSRVLYIDNIMGSFIASSGPFYTVTTNVDGNGSISITDKNGIPLTGTSFEEGSEIILQAKASIGYVFSGWSGCSTSTNSSLPLTVTGNTSCTATFQDAPDIIPSCTLTVSKWNFTVIPTDITATINAQNQSPSGQVKLQTYRYNTTILLSTVYLAYEPGGIYLRAYKDVTTSITFKATVTSDTGNTATCSASSLYLAFLP